jgi:hypothetical protein
VAVLLAGSVLTACTSSGTHANGSSGGTGSVSGTPSSTDALPIDTGPTRAATAASCPLASADFIRNTMGMRLGRIAVLRSGGRVVGCRFYALQNSPLHASEHLPGPKQPVVEITTQRYRSATAAHNAFVRLATSAKNAERANLGRTIGLCFQAEFYPKDHGNDWACAASAGTAEVLVRTVDITGSFSTAAVTKEVLRRV